MKNLNYTVDKQSCITLMLFKQIFRNMTNTFFTYIYIGKLMIIKCLSNKKELSKILFFAHSSYIHDRNILINSFLLQSSLYCRIKSNW